MAANALWDRTAIDGRPRVAHGFFLELMRNRFCRNFNSANAIWRYRHHGEEHDIKDLDPTPRATAEQWRFTPSLLDPNSYAFSSFANQPPGYYTPTPGGTNTIYHSQAGDLHTPGYAMGVGTPLSMPTSEAGVQVGQPPPATMHQFNAQVMAPHLFQNPNPFAYEQPLPHAQDHQQSFAPHQFSHQQSHFDQFQHHHMEQPKLQEYPVDVEMQGQGPLDHFSHQSMEHLQLPVAPTTMSLPPVEKYVLQAPGSQPAPFGVDWVTNFGSNFRYHSTLNAPTAMIKHADEIPVTYLNKGQSYTISVVDTKPVNFGAAVPTYRTYVRISFEDEQQRQRPAQCWQLWKEGRGTNEAHHRGGRLQAVEFVDPTQSSGLDQTTRPRFEVEYSSFDGFVVKWWPVSNGSAECAIPVRFNFLSTDFSHSKGVKGIPVRLCAKTQILLPDLPLDSPSNEAETCYCKVKLFRDHGAERKLSNDVAHVKKSIDKLKQQIAQAESGMKDFGKRKRSESSSKPGSASKPGKVPKHKRTWSLSSTSDGGIKGGQDEDLHSKLQVLQDMFTSTRPASVLFLKGDEADDPDLHPVQLTGELQRVDTADSTGWEKQSTNASSMVSPTPSQLSQDRPESSTFQRATPFQSSSRLGSGDWQSAPQTATGDLHPTQMPPPDVPIKVQKSHVSGPLPEWIEAIGVDYNYQPPPERIVKPGMFD
jgi:CP2 transcription factor